ncbi:unnamed protein product [Danaus chrysippus]|uniref:(African queen) hypothetical protein n=1 Tax=Danaus chrysippus TaxID=151541 RepID=A0A8J2W930_9NEOP|nr:unnamed protein product [Danaus chrysippus]
MPIGRIKEENGGHGPVLNTVEKGGKGDKGEKGEKGEKGKKGDKGEKGENGEKGERGEKGSPGTRGLDGAKGDKGEMGLPGIIGLTGLKGDKGDIGEQGPKGENGKDCEGLSAAESGHTNVGSKSMPAYTCSSIPDDARFFKIAISHDEVRRLSAHNEISLFQQSSRVIKDNDMEWKYYK